MSLSKKSCHCRGDKTQSMNLLIKQKISLLTTKHHCKYKPILRNNSKEAPLCTSYRGSYTVEAAIALPVFLWSMIAVMSFVPILMVSAGVRSSLETTARTMALYGASAEEQDKALSSATAIAICNGMILSKGVPAHKIYGGVAGIHYELENITGNDIHLKVSYAMEIPLGILGTKRLVLTDQVSSRKWVGWDPSEAEGEQDYVYITARGTAYHSTLSCAYLNPTIRSVPFEQLEQERSESGGKYSGCPSCKSAKNHKEYVYVTNYGSVYHCKLDCSGLKRTIYRIHMQDADGYTPCSKCVDTTNVGN